MSQACPEPGLKIKIFNADLGEDKMNTDNKLKCTIFISDNGKIMI